MKEENKFVTGLLCGVLLTLFCLTVSLHLYRQKLSDTAKTDGIQTEASPLALDGQAIGQKIEVIEDLVNENFRGEVDSEEVETYLYSGLVAGLGDVHCDYYTKEELLAAEESTSGVYTGIGVTLVQEGESGEIIVAVCNEGTPAEKAGIRPGDIVRGLDGISTEGMTLTELVERIRTKAEKRMTLTLERDAEEFEVSVEKQDIAAATVEWEMLENGIGYLWIKEFDSVTTEQFREALSGLENAGMEKLIVDVRNNPGGVLEVACDVLDQLLPEGLLVYTEDKNENRKEYFSDDTEVFTKPLAVLTNERSASAAEIFAGAVKDYGAGTLIGETTYGKGSVQKIYGLSDGTGVKLTTARYFTPKGNDIHEKGITPDIEVAASDTASEDGTNDSQLQAAIEFLQSE